MTSLWKPKDTIDIAPGIINDPTNKLIETLTANFSEVAGIIAPAIVKVEGFGDKSSYDILMELTEIKDFMDIMTAVLEFSKLTDDESKNLPSSSATLPAGQTGASQPTAGIASNKPPDV